MDILPMILRARDDTLKEARDAERIGQFAKAAGLYQKAANLQRQYADRLGNPTAKVEGRASAEQLERRAQELMRPGYRPPAPPPPPTPGPDHASKEPNKADQWLVADKPSVRLKDIAGLEEAKEQIRRRMILPYAHPDLAKRYRVAKGGGILLWGPPGTGKTLLARAAAGELDAAFFVVKGSDLMSKWVGESEQNVAALFGKAREYPRAVIFIDEIEGLAPRRGGSDTSVMSRVVDEFLQQLEGFEERSDAHALLFLGATNKPWQLDEAIMRPGRFDIKVYVPPPDPAGRLQILRANFEKRPLAPEVDLEEVARQTDGYTGADLRAVADDAAGQAFQEAITTNPGPPIQMRHIEQALQRIHASATRDSLAPFERWRREHGG